MILGVVFCLNAVLAAGPTRLILEQSVNQNREQLAWVEERQGQSALLSMNSNYWTISADRVVLGQFSVRLDESLKRVFELLRSEPTLDPAGTNVDLHVQKVTIGSASKLISFDSAHPRFQWFSRLAIVNAVHFIEQLSTVSPVIFAKDAVEVIRHQKVHQVEVKKLEKSVPSHFYEEAKICSASTDRFFLCRIPGYGSAYFRAL